MSDLAEYAEIPLWSEIVGTFQGLHANDRYLYAKIGDKVLLFAKGSEEAETVREKLADSLVGSIVAILRTDKAFFVRTIKTAE